MKRHKYGAKATVVDGIRFASQAEARRYGELKLLEKAREITGLLCQPRFDLYVSETSVSAALRRTAANMAGKMNPVQPVKVGAYVADFSYWRDDKRVVEDVKGVRTPLYKWKKKHVEAQYGITITEVTRR